jgi:ubiquinone/menaquinone biosynthesis C-methylase UbiE
MTTWLEWTTCPVCDGATHTPYVEFEGALRFVRCAGCGVVFKRAEVEGLQAKDLYERDYFHGRRSGRDRRFDHRARKAMRWVRDALQFIDGRRLLDVGCSLGYVIEGGKRLGLASSGVDISSYAVKVCQERGYDAKVGTLEQLPFDDASFDVVTMKHVLEHTHEPMRALAEVTRVLGPGGVVLIAVPDVGYWKGVWQRRTYRYFRPDDLGQQHHVYYSHPSLRRLLERAGFEVVANSKGLYRPKEAARGFAHRVYEAVRAGVLGAAFGLAGTLRLRRELFVIARRRVTSAATPATPATAATPSAAPAH